MLAISRLREVVSDFDGENKTDKYEAVCSILQ